MSSVLLRPDTGSHEFQVANNTGVLYTGALSTPDASGKVKKALLPKTKSMFLGQNVYCITRGITLNLYEAKTTVMLQVGVHGYQGHSATEREYI